MGWSAGPLKSRLKKSNANINVLVNNDLVVAVNQPQPEVAVAA